MNYRDKLYFRLKEKIPNNVISVLHLYFTRLIRHEIMANHFNPNNTLTNEWWNKTHFYIYHYKKIPIIIEHALNNLDKYLIFRFNANAPAFIAKKIDEINV